MELDNIEKLLEKYFEATTTVAEEEILRTYFLSDDVASHLEQYSQMFRYFSNAKEERYTKPVALKTRTTIYKWASVAAVVVFMLGFYFTSTVHTSPEDLEEVYTAQEIAAAQEAFALLAMNFNKGTEQLYHLEEFEKSTNKFLIKE
ncbi:hypothetical protein ACFQZJ_09770 [Maribacter chungangensis]|uniref:DUF3379 domain-containing protein n=1 Tax=Maribacter chungangensis TaxID=1069117 RepID=A0ABW3B538_9FLAO